MARVKAVAQRLGNKESKTAGAAGCQEPADHKGSAETSAPEVTGVQKKTKRRKFFRRARAHRIIRNHQRNERLFWNSEAGIRRLTKHIIKEVAGESSSYCIQAEAVNKLRGVADSFLTEYLGKAYQISVANGRQTLRLRDLRVATALVCPELQRGLSTRAVHAWSVQLYHHITSIMFNKYEIGFYFTGNIELFWESPPRPGAQELAPPQTPSEHRRVY